MKEFQNPEITVTAFAVDDIITASGSTGNPNCPYETPEEEV